MALGLAMTVAVSACCGAEEEHAVTVSAPDSLTVAVDGATRRVEAITRLDESQVDPSTFEFVFNTIEGSRSGEGIALTLSGTGPTQNELVILVLALPVSLSRGDEYQVGETFTVEPSVSSDPLLWGPHDLQQSSQAGAAFTMATYSFPPAQYSVTFRAVTSSGTVRVTQRQRGWVELSLNLVFTDAGGKTTAVTGRAQANSERFTPACT